MISDADLALWAQGGSKEAESFLLKKYQPLIANRWLWIKRVSPHAEKDEFWSSASLKLIRAIRIFKKPPGQEGAFAAYAKAAIQSCALDFVAGAHRTHAREELRDELREDIEAPCLDDRHIEMSLECLSDEDMKMILERADRPDLSEGGVTLFELGAIERARAILR